MNSNSCRDFFAEELRYFSETNFCFDAQISPNYSYQTIDSDFYIPHFLLFPEPLYIISNITEEVKEPDEVKEDIEQEFAIAQEKNSFIQFPVDDNCLIPNSNDKESFSCLTSCVSMYKSDKLDFALSNYGKNNESNRISIKDIPCFHLSLPYPTDNISNLRDLMNQVFNEQDKIQNIDNLAKIYNEDKTKFKVAPKSLTFSYPEPYFHFDVVLFSENDSQFILSNKAILCSTSKTFSFYFEFNNSDKLSFIHISNNVDAKMFIRFIEFIHGNGFSLF